VASMRRALAIVAMATACIGCDQETKRLAVESLRDARPIDLLFGTIRLLYAENTGAWGSLGAGWFPALKSIVFILLPCLALLALLIHTLRTTDRRFTTTLACALLIGGGLGNIIDRIRSGYVVDFIYMGIGPIGTNIFNIADVAVVAGVLLLLLFRAKPTKARIG